MPGIGIYQNGVQADPNQMMPQVNRAPVGADIMRWLEANPQAGQDAPLVLDRGQGPTPAEAQQQFNKWLREQQRRLPPQPSNDVAAWEEFMRSQRPQGGAMTDAYGRRLPMQYWLGM